ncbi:MAG: hypothetical protein M9928_09495 [Anaerolineae bacterium]|nr:hypothetical protein [Anaerolineae bacterium]MCO5205255.1 hypothetical protein [Anaerolineae bacterium]
MCSHASFSVQSVHACLLLQGIRQIVYVYPVNMTCALIVVLFGVLAVHRPNTFTR